MCEPQKSQFSKIEDAVFKRVLFSGEVTKEAQLCRMDNEMISYVFHSMPYLRNASATFAKSKPFKDYRVLVTLHPKPAEIPFVLSFKVAGAKEVIFVPHRYSLDLKDSFSASNRAFQLLMRRGVKVILPNAETKKHRLECIRSAYVKYEPNLLSLHRAEELKALLPLMDTNEVRGATILTGAQIHDLERKKLLTPVVAITLSEIKGIGENPEAARSIISETERITHRSFYGKFVLVVGGAGSVGKALCNYLKLVDARVLVGEIARLPTTKEFLAVKGLILKGRAWKENGLSIADVVITVAGRPNILTYSDVLRHSKDGQIIVSGGSRDLDGLVRDLRRFTLMWRLWRGLDVCIFPDGRRIYLIAEGKAVNLYGDSPGSSMTAIDPVMTLNLVALKHLCQKKAKSGITKPSIEMEEEALRYGISGSMLSLGVLCS